MKLFLFERIDQASKNYHGEGGLVVVAQDEADAVRLLQEYNERHEDSWTDGGVVVTDEEWGEVIAYELSGDPEPAIYVFPDAGCC